MSNEEIKSLIEQLKAQGLSEEEIMETFYETFTEGKMDRKDLEALAEAMGYELTDDFKNEPALDPIASEGLEGADKEVLEEAKEIAPEESEEEFKEKLEDAKEDLGEEEKIESEDKEEEKEEAEESEEEKSEEEPEKSEELEESEEDEWEKAQKMFKI